MDLNGDLLFPGGQAPQATASTPVLPPRGRILALPVGQITAADLATVMQGVIQTVTGCTVSFDETRGQYTFVTTEPVRLPTGEELRDPAWRGNWFGPAYDRRAPMDLNYQLHLPTSSLTTTTTTGMVQLIPYTEVFLHSRALTSNRTLKSSGERDVLVCIPVNYGFGETVEYRSYGPTDAISLLDKTLRIIDFTFRDWQGNPVELQHHCSLELCLIDNDPYTF
jgi:hypothetical protein